MSYRTKGRPQELQECDVAVFKKLKQWMVCGENERIRCCRAFNFCVPVTTSIIL